MTARTRERPAANGPDALKIAGRQIAPDGTPALAIAPSCPLACSPSCAFRCPVSLGDSLAVLVDELVQR